MAIYVKKNQQIRIDSLRNGTIYVCRKPTNSPYHEESTEKH